MTSGSAFARFDTYSPFAYNRRLLWVVTTLFTPVCRIESSLKSDPQPKDLSLSYDESARGCCERLMSTRENVETQFGMTVRETLEDPFSAHVVTRR